MRKKREGVMTVCLHGAPCWLFWTFSLSPRAHLTPWVFGPLPPPLLWQGHAGQLWHLCRDPGLTAAAAGCRVPHRRLLAAAEHWQPGGRFGVDPAWCAELWCCCLCFKKTHSVPPVPPGQNLLVPCTHAKAPASPLHPARLQAPATFPRRRWRRRMPAPPPCCFSTTCWGRTLWPSTRLVGG